MAKLGSLEITKDDSDRESWFELTIQHGLVENAKRIDNLLRIVWAWKTTEVSLDGELIGKQDLQNFLIRIEDARRCWLKRRRTVAGNGDASVATHPDCASQKSLDGAGRDHPCGPLGCDALRVHPSHEFLAYAGNDGPSWWAVGSFDGEHVIIDKDALKRQIGRRAQ